LLEVIRRHWGFDSLRPLQEQAMRAVLDGRDSLLVLPTGAGKSLCYQAPAVLRGAVTVVISPLISLMKDQVDGLRACGVPAVQLNSSLSNEELRDGEQAVVAGKVRLLFASPERMATGSFRGLLKRAEVRTFAIDEAHCISHWGHDFRPEYRQLRELKRHFPQASVHAFTATATERVRADIIEQLGLSNAELLVGNFDRPNLTYRVMPRYDQFAQVLEVIRRHAGEAGIVYCIRRRDVDDLTPLLKSAGINAIPYHAGMEANERKAAHDQFSEEKCDVVVATVAFGMGIDRSNIRYVLHTGMPKSIEHYQQETGRAGRDGLEAECVLLYSGSDAVTWRKLIQKSVAEAETPVDPHYLDSAFGHIADMDRYCHPVTCRHRSLVEYFGQEYAADNCGACDLCLGDAEPVADAQTIAKKILSCVYRVQESFGAAHVTSVLRGANTSAIRERGHDRLSTYGLLSDRSASEVRDFIQQLIGQGALAQVGNEYPLLKLNAASWDVMNDRQQARLVAIPLPESAAAAGSGKPARTSKSAAASWEGVDRGLFEVLRALRLEQASARGVPPYLIFSDATLRDLARVRPSSLDAMRLIYGIGDAKLRDFGQTLLDSLDAHCRAQGLSRDNAPAPRTAPAVEEGPRRQSAGASHAALLFRQGASLEEVRQQLNRARSTVAEYLCDYIRSDRPTSIAAWVSDDLYRQVAEAVTRIGSGPLKPIFVALEEKVPYEIIRAVVTHLGTREEQCGLCPPRGLENDEIARSNVEGKPKFEKTNG
jgi:ATP-dependent DNA helicase RecQ